MKRAGQLLAVMLLAASCATTSPPANFAGGHGGVGDDAPLAALEGK